MTREFSLAAIILLTACAAPAQAQSAGPAIERGSQAEARILAGRSAAPLVEKGSQAEARILYGGGDAQRTTSAGLREAAVQREKAAKATSPKDKLLIEMIVEQLRTNNSSINFHFAEDANTGLGAVFRIRPYRYLGLEGTAKSVQPLAQVLKITGNKKMLIEYHSGSLSDGRGLDFHRLMLRGMDMSKIAEGDAVPLNGYFVIKGSEYYYANPKAAPQKVLQLELIDTKPYLDEIKRAADEKAEQEKAAELAKREANFRKWTSTSGNHTVEALLSSYANGSVTLDMRDGKKIKVDVTKLSEADQAYVSKWRHDKR